MLLIDLLVRAELTTGHAGMRFVPWGEWWRRFRKHGFAWRKYP